MTLYNYVTHECDVEELPVHDKGYYMETYFYRSSLLNPTDYWDKAMVKIAKMIEVVEVDDEEEYKGGIYTAGVTTNLSDVIGRNIDNGVFKELFICNDIDSIMEDIENIFAGHVSEHWLTEFANSLI